MRGRRIARTPVTIMGDIRRSDAAGIGRAYRPRSNRSDRPTRRPRSPGATPQHSGISCPNDLPLPATLTDLSITLTYALTVRAIRKGNPIAKSRLISNACASHIRALRSATIFFFWVVFSIVRIPRADSQSRQDTREPRLRNTPPGCPILLPLWRPFRPTGRTPGAIEIRRASGGERQFGRHCLIPRRGEQIAASASVTATFSRGHACVRTLRDGLPHHRATVGHPNEEAAASYQ